MSDHLPRSLRFPSNDDAVTPLATYYSRVEPFVGATFDAWCSPHCEQSSNNFTADDVLAVNFLSVAVPPAATQQLLVAGSNAFSRLLERISEDQSFWEAGIPGSDTPQWQLETELLGLRGVGLTIGSKLMARKRPHLVPISDSVVRQSLGLNKAFWEPLYGLFSDRVFRERLMVIRNEEHRRDDVSMPADLPLLRVFDVVAWMDGKKADGNSGGSNGWPDQPVTSS